MAKKQTFTKASLSKEMGKLRDKIKELKSEMYEHEIIYGYHNGYNKMKNRLENLEEQYEILSAAWQKCDWAEKTGLPIGDDTALHITVKVEERHCIPAYLYTCNFCRTELFLYEKHEMVECPKCKKYIRTASDIKMRIERGSSYE